MTPSQIRQYLRERPQATLTDMATRFDSDPESVRAVLVQWQHKGRVVQVEGDTRACGHGCASCGGTGNPVFAWREPENGNEGS